MTGQPHYKGDLSETTLPEMLYSIDRFRVPGVIEVRDGEVVKRVYLRDGYVIHATSTHLGDRLGDFLVRSGKLSAGDFEALSKARSSSDQRFGVLVIEQGLLSPREIYEAIQGHVEEIVWSLFYWESGDVGFGIGDFQDEAIIHIQLPLRQVIVEGIKRAPDAKPLVGRLGRRETVLEPCFRWEELIELGLEQEDFDLLMLVDARRSLYQLCSDGPRTPSENAKILYAFQVLHLVRQRTGPEDRARPVALQQDTGGDAPGLRSRRRAA